MAVVACLSLVIAERADAALLTVTTTNDETTPTDGLCSLREAVAAVSAPGTATDCGTADPTGNYILLQTATYTLSIPRNPSKDDNSNGDLNLTGTDPVTILGTGPTTTTIAAAPGLNDRLITVAPPATVGLAALTLTAGHAPDGQVACPGGDGSDGGAIYNEGLLSLNIVTVAGNQAGAGGAGKNSGCNGGKGGNGGGVANECFKTPKGKDQCGTVNVDSSMFLNDNQAGTGGAGATGAGTSPGGTGGDGGSGAALANTCAPTACGQVLFTNSTAAGNFGGAGGSGGDGGSSGGNGGAGGNGGWGGAIYVSANGSTGSSSLTITNDTFAGNAAGTGGAGGNGAGGGNGGTGGNGGNGGAVAVDTFPSTVLNATIASNAIGTAGAAGSPSGKPGNPGDGGGLYTTGPKYLTLQNSITAANTPDNCVSPSAVTNGGHNLDTDGSCPAAIYADPQLMPLADYGGFSATLALEPSSPAINAVPTTGAACPATDQRSATRPQGSACDIGAFEFAKPHIKISTPRKGAHYKRHSRVIASYQCTEGGINPLAPAIVSCTGTVPNGKRIDTKTLGKKTFKVTATDKQGNTKTKKVHYTVVKG
jgi:CSLREA domain-containing protein